jgi:hypothetical protein
MAQCSAQGRTNTGVGGLTTTILKAAVGRARPYTLLGTTSFSRLFFVKNDIHGRQVIPLLHSPCRHPLAR